MQTQPADLDLVVAITEPALRDQLVAELRRRRHIVEVAADGFAALERTWRLKPKLAVLDHDLPHLDDLMVLKRLKKDRRTALLPVIMLVGLKARQQAEDARFAGALESYIRPVQLDVLIARIEAQVGSKEVVWL